MHLALAPQHHFLRLGIVHDGDRGILLEQLVQRLAELDVVLALLGGDREREHRRERLHLRDRFVGLLAGAQRIAGPGMIELGVGDRLAGRGRAAFFGALAEQLERAGDAAGVALGRREGDAVAGLAGQHARNRHLAAMRGVERLEHIGDGFART